ncbi:peptidoglycan DD-metalloendopeptidase family protein [bacterium]|nr:peptidoglycan DD-metalloendopeptidase family protein [bacterium]
MIAMLHTLYSGLALSVIHFLFRQFFYSSLILIPVMLLLRFMQRSSVYYKTTLLLLFWIRLVLPPDYAAPWSMRQTCIRLSTSGHHTTEDIDYRLHQESSEVFDQMNGKTLSNGPFFNAILIPVLFGLWMTGVIMCLTKYNHTHQYYRRLIRNSAVIHDPKIHRIADRWMRRFHIRRTVRLLSTTERISPFVSGILHPCIILPASTLNPENLNVIESIIAHELAHVRHGDNFWIHVQAALEIVYFFHPGIWWASGQLNTYRECAADDGVVKYHGFSRDQYIQSLMLLVKSSQKHKEVRMEPAFIHYKKRLAERLAHIYTSRPIKRKGILFFTGAFVLSIVFILPMQIQSTEPAQVTQDEKSGSEPMTFRSPCENAKITAPFGMMEHPLNKNIMRMHRGVDLAHKRGTPVYAAANGLVAIVNDSAMLRSGYGNHVIIRHENGYESWYAHMDTVLVKNNQHVKQGFMIGRIGSTGKSTGPHLHFEIRENNQPVNPENFIQF